MSYFLDFDRTIFDTDAFVEYVQSQKISTQGYGRPDFGSIWNTLVCTGELRFLPGELSPFIHDDASRFLEQNGDNTAIVTCNNYELQRAKIESAISPLLRLKTYYARTRQKGRLLRSLLPNFTPPHIFVDDSVPDLESVESATLGSIRLFEIRRDGTEGSGVYPIIKNLDELP